MEGLSGVQLIVGLILSSGIIGSIMSLFMKSMWSPESKNDLARIGNEFAHQLLADAKSEREELRATIRELENVGKDHTASIARLNRIVAEKDVVINELEQRQIKMAHKLQKGEVITLQDIFGERAPKGLTIVPEDDS